MIFFSCPGFALVIFFVVLVDWFCMSNFFVSLFAVLAIWWLMINYQRVVDMVVNDQLPACCRYGS